MKISLVAMATVLEKKSDDISFKTSELILMKFRFGIYVMVIQNLAKKVMIRNSRWPPCPYVIKTFKTTSSPKSRGQFG